MGRVTFSERGSVGTAPAEHTVFAEIPAGNDATTAGVAWGAVIAGAFVAAALSLALLAMGTGIGLSAISPWAKCFGIRHNDQLGLPHMADADGNHRIINGWLLGGAPARPVGEGTHA